MRGLRRGWAISTASALLLLALLSAGCGTDLSGDTALTPATAIISGELGYPSDWVPPMTVYAENRRTGDVFYAETNSSPGLLPYGLEVSAPGTYTVYAWTRAGYMTDESLGSYYLGGDITGVEVLDDLSMKEVRVLPGETVTGIDIFHFGDLPQRVPQPPSEYRIL